MRSFSCPHNRDTTIHNTCPITECPYHVERVGKLFRVDRNTGCTYYDTHLLSSETPSRTQISALSRDPSRMVAPGAIRGLYSELLRNASTLYALTHDVVVHAHCTCCGYVGHNCVSASLCGERNTWVTSVLHNVFRIAEVTTNAKAIIWHKLVHGELALDPANIRAGFDLCSADDVRIGSS